MGRSYRLLIVTVCFFLSNGRGLIAQDLKSDIHALNAMRKGRDTDLEAVDRRGADLLKKYPDAKDQGQIYYALADANAQSGMVHPERVAEYARKALEHPLDSRQRERLYVYWGDALQLRNPKEAFPDRRKSAVQRYLEGLKPLLEYNLPDKPPELPSISRFDAGRSDGPIYEAMKQQHDQEVVAREKAEFQRQMIKHRDVLIGQIAALYGHRPYAREEVERLAHDALGNSPLVNKLMAAVDVKMKADAARVPRAPVPIASGPPKPTWREPRWKWTLASLAVLAAIGVVCLVLEIRKRRRGAGK